MLIQRLVRHFIGKLNHGQLATRKAEARTTLVPPYSRHMRVGSFKPMYIGECLRYNCAIFNALNVAMHANPGGNETTF